MNDPRLATLDLFSGIGGIALGLRPYTRTVAWCESEPWCRAVLRTRMAAGELCEAPIHRDVRQLGADDLRAIGVERVDLVTAGFPCQDISVAGLGRGLAGERSGLFREVARLVGELGPRFVFLENSPLITRRGLDTVLGRLVALGYDCRWCVQAALDAGAPQIRERWWCLAHAPGHRAQPEPLQRGLLVDAAGTRVGPAAGPRSGDGRGPATDIPGRDGERREEHPVATIAAGPRQHHRLADPRRPVWYREPDVDRVADGVPHVVDRVRGLGNAVVPQAAEAAFRFLMGLDHDHTSEEIP